MSSPLRSRLVLRVALIALIAVTAAEISDAYLSMFGRLSPISFDDPATPMHDEILWVSSPAGETGAHAGPSTCLAVTTWRPLACSTAPSPRGTSGVRSGITRAPPAP